MAIATGTALAMAAIGTLASAGVSAYQAHQTNKATKKVESQNKKARREADALQKSAEMTDYNSAQRAARLTASRGTGGGRQGTVLGGGVNLSQATNGTPVTPTKTLLGQ